MKILQCNPRWLNVPDSVWLAAFQKPVRHGLLAEVADIVPELMAYFSLITGLIGKASHPAVPVVHRKGRRIAAHQHPEHLIIYYPIGHPCKLLAGDDEYTPVKNTAVYLPPMAMHSVEPNKNKKVRLSLALRWKSEL